MKIPGASYRRVLLACLVISLVGLLIQAGLLLCEWWLSESIVRVPLPVQLIPVVLGLGLTLAVPWLCVKWLLRTTLGRAALATLIMLVGGTAANVALALSLRHTLAEAFVIPTGAMAPTVYGAHADLTCDGCGFDYTVSMSGWTLPGARRRREPVPAACPNCGQPDSVPVAIPFSRETASWSTRSAGPNGGI